MLDSPGELDKGAKEREGVFEEAATRLLAQRTRARSKTGLSNISLSNVHRQVDSLD